MLPLTYCVGSYKTRMSELVRHKASVLSVHKVSSGEKTVEVSSHGVYEVKRAEEPLVLNAEANGDKTLEKNSSSEFVDLTKDWFKLNVGQTGFYRVKYDEELASRLRSAISAGSLEATDRFGTYCLTYFVYQRTLVYMISVSEVVVPSLIFPHFS